MRWFNRKKRLFLIKLMALLGYGGMTAYCIGGCDSKPAQNESQTPSTNEVIDKVSETVVAEASEPKAVAEDSAQKNESDNSIPMPDAEPAIGDANTPSETGNDDSELDNTQNENADNSAAESELAAQKPELLTFEISSVPNHAMVIKNSKVICKSTPCQYTFKTSSKRETLEIVAPGYFAQKVVLSEEKHTKSQGAIKVALKPDIKRHVPKYAPIIPPDIW